MGNPTVTGGFLRMAGARTHSGGGSSFLGSGNIEDRGGRMHQSMSPRCSELRKSFRISQRIAPIPRLLYCQGLRSCPSGTQRPRPCHPKTSPRHRRIPQKAKPALAPFADVALTPPQHPPNTLTSPQPSPSVQSAPSYYPDTDILPVNTSCRPPGQGRQWWACLYRPRSFRR